MSVAAIASVAVVSALVGLVTGLSRKYVLLLVLSILTVLVVEGILANSSTGFFSSHKFGDSIAEHLIIAVITSSLVYLAVAFLRGVFAIEAHPVVTGQSGITLEKESSNIEDFARFKKQVWLIYLPLMFMPVLFLVASPVALLSWIYCRRKGPVLRFAATEALTFSVTWTAVFILHALYLIFGAGSIGLPIRYIELGTFLCSCIPAVIAVYAAMQVSKGKLMRLPLNYRYISAPHPTEATDLSEIAGVQQPVV